MKAEQVVGGLFGGTIVLLLMLFGWYLMWDDAAQVHIKAVEDSLRRQEAIWDKAGAQSSFRYDEIIASGFPFYTEVRVLRPHFNAMVQGQSLRISGPYISFLPTDEAQWRYSVEFLPDFTVTMGGNKEYYLHLYDLPEILVHAPPAQLVQTTKFNEYGIKLPTTFLVGIQREKNNRKVKFQYVPTDEPLWHYIPNDIRPSLIWFQALLKEAVG